MFTYQHGIKLTHASLWLDATRIVEAACVSHGHADHIRKHKHIFATPPTASFIRRRLGDLKITAIDYGEPFSVGEARVTFFPAGHILGSAQIRVEAGGASLLYSGDFSWRRSLTAEPLHIVQSDILIMESTYGYQQYRFPPRQDIIERLCRFVAQTLKMGATPMVFGYTLGKAQEAMKILADNGFALCVHGSVLHLAEVYERHGIDFGNYVRLNATTAHEKRVMILPPQARKTKLVQRIQPSRSVFLSGWGMNDSARYRYGVDEILPLSDHADFDELRLYIDAVKPKRIYTTHGPRDYYLYLRSLGYTAFPLDPGKQKELFK